MNIPECKCLAPENRSRRPIREFKLSNSNLIRRRLHLIAVLILLPVASVPATVLNFTGELEVVDIGFVGSIPSFSVGDKFDFTFTLEDAFDANPTVEIGTFSDALRDFSMTRHAGNAGNWDPATASFADLTTSPFAGDFFTRNETLFSTTTGDAFAFLLTANQNAATDTINLGAFDTLNFELVDSTAFAVDDGGLGQRFSEQLSVSSGQLRLQDFNNRTGYFNFALGGVLLDVTELNQIPEPSVGLLMGVSASFFFCRRRRPVLIAGTGRR